MLRSSLNKSRSLLTSAKNLSIDSFDAGVGMLEKTLTIKPTDSLVTRSLRKYAQFTTKTTVSGTVGGASIGALAGTGTFLLDTYENAITDHSITRPPIKALDNAIHTMYRFTLLGAVIGSLPVSYPLTKLVGLFNSCNQPADPTPSTASSQPTMQNTSKGK